MYGERARIEVELANESGALKVVAYGRIAEDIISLNAQEIMTKTIAGETCNLIGNLDLNGDNGNVDGPLVANAQTSLLSQLVPCNTEKINSVCGSACFKTNVEVIVETGEVILHTVASTTSRYSKLLKPTVVSLDSASTSSG
ncbi:hypothetical protein Syun_022691 [Stephania yunnanensis]|uniref:Uncharacterized protein n=1 Tax=Stephania yunnanensis TaxID=152371 RepID=A0AAP0I303_9MAGN